MDLLPVACGVRRPFPGSIPWGALRRPRAGEMPEGENASPACGIRATVEESPMHKLLQRLHRDHANLARVLNLLESQLNEFYEGRESDFDLKVELLEYIECYAELVHHPTEERIFEGARDYLVEKQALVEKLKDQHGRLIGAARKFRQALEGVVQGAVQSREELEIEGREFIALQRLHVDLEEAELFPFLDRCMTQKEWDAIEQALPKYNDPLFGERDPNRFRTLYRYLLEANP
jgi:hemerythrin-like domain-containing protein